MVPIHQGQCTCRSPLLRPPCPHRCLLDHLVMRGWSTHLLMRSLRPHSGILCRGGRRLHPGPFQSDGVERRGGAGVLEGVGFDHRLAGYVIMSLWVPLGATRLIAYRRRGFRRRCARGGRDVCSIPLWLDPREVHCHLSGTIQDGELKR
jgi:hypothetical protein